MDHLPQKTHQEILYSKKKIKPFRFQSSTSFTDSSFVAKRASKCDQHFCKLFPLSSVKFSLPVFEFLAKKVEEDLNLRNVNLKLTLRGKNLLDSGEVFSCLIAQFVKLVTRLFPCE